MSKKSGYWLVAALCVCLFMLPQAVATEGINGNLVSVQWLEMNLSRDDVLVLDASPPPLHAAKHIPGAVSIDVFSFGGRDVPAAEMERRIQSWGVSTGKRIVIYDQGGTFFATSLFFDLYYHGVPADALFVLDGGMTKWHATGGVTTKDPSPAPKPGTFRVARTRDEIRVRLPEFLVASGDPVNNALVEALEPGHHFGAAKFFDRAGHVPNAVLAPGTDFYNADKTFKSAAEIQRMLTYLGVRPEQQVYTHCGGGIAASVPFFAMKVMLNYPKVKLYKESQLEWLRDDRGLPFWTYAAPNMAREKGWLNGWGSQPMRNFGVARLSVIDVRSVEAYRQGHIPYAVNIPAEVFKRHLDAPEKLAAVLAAAGVDIAHEAVIISDRGINPNAAMAFIMLEKLGQKRVSVLTDSVDDWGLGGFTLTKEPTRVGPKTSPQELAIPATSYQSALRPGIVVNKSQVGKGLYPKAYVVSGKTSPATLRASEQDGKVLQVLHTELVTADGRPKAAQDIWSILVKAGLPRYAEIICIADDPGEAAANYFILKLMGYPDVKVLMT